MKRAFSHHHVILLSLVPGRDKRMTRFIVGLVLSECFVHIAIVSYLLRCSTLPGLITDSVAMHV